MERRVKGKRARHGAAKKYVIRLVVTMLCVCVMTAFNSPGRSLQEPPQAGPVPELDGMASRWDAPAGKSGAKAPAPPIRRPTGVEKAPYDYSQPVPEGQPVDDSYFADAVFVGDSRTEGLLLYSGIAGAANLAYKGMTVESAQDKPVQFVGREGRSTALEALGERSYGKVYVMLGVNELGWPGTEQYRDSYDSLLTEIRRLQPDAAVYIQGTLPVAPSARAQKDYFNNDRVAEYNAVARQLAEEHQMYYLEVGECLADETGALPEEAGVDGIHLTRAYYVKWFEYLKCHTAED